MPEADAERDEIEVLASDFMERLRQGEFPSIEDYAAAHPALAGEIRDLFPTIAAAEQVKTQRLSRSQTTLRLARAGTTAAAAHPDDAAAPPPVRAGMTLGKYTLVERVGQGCLGTVWRSSHPELGIPLAIKVLRPELMGRSAAQVQRFLREARTAAQLNHPHVVRVFDAGCDQGLYFIAMEYVDGGSLGELLRQAGGKLAVARAVEIITAMAAALHAAAEFGIVHRDIKPDNILLDRKGTPKLADLGLAKQLTDNEQPELTGTGVSMGTPLYVAPEQAMGEGAPDARADIYSLGATFYHLVTGTPPFTGATAYQIVHRHAHVPVVDPRERNPEIPAELAGVIQRMLAKNPADRYASAKELLDDLSRIADGLKPEPWAPSRWQGRLRRWRGPAIAAVVSATVVSTVLLLPWSGRRPGGAESSNTTVQSVPPPTGSQAADTEISSRPPPRRTPAAASRLSPADWQRFEGSPRPDVHLEPLRKQDYEFAGGVLRVTSRPGPDPDTLVYTPTIPSGPVTIIMEARNLRECGFLGQPGESGGCRIVLQDQATSAPPDDSWRTIEIRRVRDEVVCTVDGRPADKIERAQATGGNFVIPLPRDGACEIRKFTVRPGDTPDDPPPRRGNPPPPR